MVGIYNFISNHGILSFLLTCNKYKLIKILYFVETASVSPIDFMEAAMATADMATMPMLLL